MISVTQQLLLNWENASAKGLASTWSHKVWFFTMMSDVTSFHLQHEPKWSSSVDSVIFILCFFLFYKYTRGSYLLTAMITLPWLKCGARVTSTLLACMINSWASYCVRKELGTTNNSIVRQTIDLQTNRRQPREEYNFLSHFFNFCNFFSFQAA